MEPSPQGSPIPVPPQSPGVTIRGRHFGLPWILGAVVASLLIVSCVCCSAVGLAGALNKQPSAAAPQGTSGITQAKSSTATATATATQAPKPTATATPKPAPKWVVTHAYKGNGIQKTEPFTVTADHWRISWSCNPAAYGFSYNLIADLTVPGADFGESVVNVICDTHDPSSLKGVTAEYTSGTFYLAVNSEASWTFLIEELR